MKKLAAAAFALAFGLIATGAFAAELTVSAAASLSESFTQISQEFTKETGVKVNLNFASSNNLLRQMEQGAPVDVFASADQETMDSAQKKSLIDPATRKNFALNDLVLITPASGSLAGPEALAGADVKHIAIGTPESVPAGRYAREALTSAGMWENLRSKFVFGNNVRQVLSYIQRGEADAGFVYRTDALAGGKDVRIVTAMTGHKPVCYPIAVTKDSASQEAAKRFVDFVLSPRGLSILADHGFSPVK
ncbi:molybdate ABC transporter substrate-binding protein [Mailhella sp.]|uniref:molybdate ABC transporter substrate-binding protein n=1 Tax=Mailhella sp. TaxID=1981029 RepID=UPI003AB16C19